MLSSIGIRAAHATQHSAAGAFSYRKEERQLGHCQAPSQFQFSFPFMASRSDALAIALSGLAVDMMSLRHLDGEMWSLSRARFDEAVTQPEPDTVPSGAGPGLLDERWKIDAEIQNHTDEITVEP
jgi:hypothetical protein